MTTTDHVVKLYSILQSFEALRILRTSGSSDRGTTITVEVSQPTPLSDLLAEMPELDAREIAGGDDGSLRSRLGSLGGKPEGRARIAVSFPESDAPVDTNEEPEEEGEEA
jgi:hypothetical protein